MDGNKEHCVRGLWALSLCHCWPRLEKAAQVIIYWILADITKIAIFFG